MKKYTVKVKKPEYWQEIHNLLCEETDCECIPNRKINCSDEKLHSSTKSTYELEESEVEELTHNEKIEWIELSPIDNPDNYPKPQPATTRFPTDVKIYRDLDLNGPPQSNPTSSELNRTNWAVKRVGLQTNSDFWDNLIGNPAVLLGNIEYTSTGANVDIVIHDSGVLQYHPEFMDDNNQSRVRDIVLDGPYYIDPDYFVSIGATYTKPDDRVGITTASAHDWWENSSSRSVAFQSAGTVLIPANYTEANALGDNLNGSNTMTSGHGTACAGLSAGKNFGLAFEADIWNMSAIADPTGMGIEASYDLMKIWHKNKPVNPSTGVKNPTVINGSWGYQAAFTSSSTVNYKFRNSTGTFTGNDAVTNQVTAMKDGLSNQVAGAYKSWSSSSRSNSTDTAGSELMDEGVIYVAAAGNNNQRLGVGVADPDRLNYMSDVWFGSTDPRPEFPAGTVPSNHRDWMNPQGIGFDEVNDFHPVICVGAMDEFIENNLSERKASYSNNGPGIDVWAPADETLSAGTNGLPSYTDYQRYDNSQFYDCYFNGTSAAAPVVTGLVALYLENNPSASSLDVKSWLSNTGSNIVPANQYLDQYDDDTQTNYWTESYNLRGAQRRLLYNPYNGSSSTQIGTELPYEIPLRIYLKV
jgi:hypothetical protein